MSGGSWLREWPLPRLSRSIIHLIAQLVVVDGLAVIGVEIFLLVVRRPSIATRVVVYSGVGLLLVGAVVLLPSVVRRVIKGVSSTAQRFGRFSDISVAFFFVGVVLMLAGILGLSGGTPTDASDDCSYRLARHGTASCVSRAAYAHAGAAQQRLELSVFLVCIAAFLFLASLVLPAPHGAATPRWRLLRHKQESPRRATQDRHVPPPKRQRAQ